MADEHEPIEPEDLDEPPPFFPKELGRGGFTGSPVPVEVEGVYTAEDGNTVHRFVQLQDELGRRLPIAIGPYEAMAIHFALEGTEVPRPMTHDLACTLLQRLNGVLEKVVIDDLWNSTYYAKLHIKQGDQHIEIDCRPSDALAIGLRLGARIYVLDSILDAVNEEE
ncbi:MAG: bifunctional nuclease family protein [Fimbriimonadales bacterium]|nr:bifunctional nuclease family protein [Fimbriimonadales bacterium]